MSSKSSRWTLKEQEAQRKAAEKKYPRITRRDRIKNRVQAPSSIDGGYVGGHVEVFVDKHTGFRTFDVSGSYPKISKFPEKTKSKK